MLQPSATSLLSDIEKAAVNKQMFHARVAAIRSLVANGASSVLVRDSLLQTRFQISYLDLTPRELDNVHQAFFFGLNCIRLAKPEEHIKQIVVVGPPCSTPPPFPDYQKLRNLASRQ
jgi:hypothetical protein